jgi:hypothetical protein
MHRRMGINVFKNHQGVGFVQYGCIGFTVGDLTENAILFHVDDASFLSVHLFV